VRDKSPGQEGPTPDFIPGWFESRLSNPDPATREAVRIPEAGDYFPITFLRANEEVRNTQRPQLGFAIGPASQPGHDRFDLAVPPGYWIVRDADGKLHNWRDEDFKAKYTRSDRNWTTPVERDVPSGRPAAAERNRHGADRGLRDDPYVTGKERERFSRQLYTTSDDVRRSNDLKGVPKRVIITADEAAYPTALRAYADLIVRNGIVVKNRTGIAGRDAYPDELAICKELSPDDARILIDAAAWRGQPPAEGTRRRLILDAIQKGDVLSDIEALEIADTVELAFLGGGDDEREADAQGAINAVGDALDRIDAPQGATYAERIDRLYRELTGGHGRQLKEKRDEAIEAHRLLDGLGVPQGPQISPPTVLNRLREFCGSMRVTDVARLDAIAEERWKRIGELEEECARLLEGREEARGGEGRYAEERDCAFALLRWLLPVTVAKRLD
jgi:hypothetical protein